MLKHNLFVIRYSVLYAGSKAFNIARDNDIDTYRKKLFDENRLDIHEFLFFNVTLPSIKKQIELQGADKNTLMVITSESLPQKYLNSLLVEQQKHSWFKVVVASEDGNLASSIMGAINFKQKTLVSTIRIDDDDTLSLDFLPKLEKYAVEENIDKCVTFSRGAYLRFDTDKKRYVQYQDAVYPMVSAGLLYIDVYDPANVRSFKTIYSLGNHCKVDSKKTLINDNESCVFLRTHYELSDTGGTRMSKDKSMNFDLDSVTFFSKNFALCPTLFKME